MKVTLKWIEEKEKEVEMTPAEYCAFYSGETWDSYFPENAMMRGYDDLSPEANKELLNYFYSKSSGRSVG